MDTSSERGASDVSTLVGEYTALLAALGTKVSELLFPASHLADPQRRAIIGRYIAALEGNLPLWFGIATITSTSEAGRAAAEKKMRECLKHNYSHLLHEFSRTAGAEPHIDDYRAVYDQVNRIRVMQSELSGVKALCLVAALLKFIEVVHPYLNDVSASLGGGAFLDANHPLIVNLVATSELVEALARYNTEAGPTTAEELHIACSLVGDLARRVLSYGG